MSKRKNKNLNVLSLKTDQAKLPETELAEESVESMAIDFVPEIKPSDATEEKFSPELPSEESEGEPSPITDEDIALALIEENKEDDDHETKPVLPKTYKSDKQFSVTRKWVTLSYKEGQIIDEDHLEFLLSVSAPISEVVGGI